MGLLLSKFRPSKPNPWPVLTPSSTQLCYLGQGFSEVVLHAGVWKLTANHHFSMESMNLSNLARQGKLSCLFFPKQGCRLRHRRVTTLSRLLAQSHHLLSYGFRQSLTISEQGPLGITFSHITFVCACACWGLNSRTEEGTEPDRPAPRDGNRRVASTAARRDVTLFRPKGQMAPRQAPPPRVTPPTTDPQVRAAEGGARPVSSYPGAGPGAPGAGPRRRRRARVGSGARGGVAGLPG
jgi:hypothetical protein